VVELGAVAQKAPPELNSGRETTWFSARYTIVQLTRIVPGTQLYNYDSRRAMRLSSSSTCFSNAKHADGLHGYGASVSEGPLLTISGNEIHHHTNRGIYLRSYGTGYFGPVATINGNSIHTNTNWELYCGTYKNPVSTFLNAENNWWGTTDPSTIASRIYDYDDSTSRPRPIRKLGRR
jgi:hypothetical protein